jgi:hypothetical protein
MQYDKRDKIDPFGLPKSPGMLAGFYLSCGPLAGLGFFMGGSQCFVSAIIGDILFWTLITLLKEKSI